MKIRHGRHRHPGREGGGVELVVGVEGQHEVHHARDLGGGLASAQEVEETGSVRSGGRTVL